MPRQKLTLANAVQDGEGADDEGEGGWEAEGLVGGSQEQILSCTLAQALSRAVHALKLPESDGVSELPHSNAC